MVKTMLYLLFDIRVILVCALFYFCLSDDLPKRKKKSACDYTPKEWAEQNWATHNSNNREENWEDEFVIAYSKWSKNGKKESEIPYFLK
jgi:hypothetical protein